MISIFNKKRNVEINITRRTISIIISLLTLLPLITRVAGWSYSSRLLTVSPCTGSRCQQAISQLTLQQQASSRQQELDSSVPVVDIDCISNSNSMATKTPSSLEAENSLLLTSILQLKEENENLKKYQKEMQQKLQEQKRIKTRNNNSNKKIILESFEGEHLFDSSPSSFRRNNNNNNDIIPHVSEEKEGKEKKYDDDSSLLSSSSTSSDILIEMEGDDELWCDSLDGDQCPLEPTISFGEALRDRAYWLVGLLILQSLSGIILCRNEALLTNHPVIIYYLTMMVGAGGNAGNQASVRVIRGLALGTLNERTRGQFLIREIKMAATLSLILSTAGFFRTIAFKTPLPEAITVTTALALIVFSSVCLGAVLPLGLEKLGIDPAHSSTTIQVIMDILGVVVAVIVSGAILDGPLGVFLLPKLGF